MGEWLELNRDGDIYTELYYLGCIGLIRTYTYTDRISNLSIISIDYQTARILHNKITGKR